MRVCITKQCVVSVTLSMSVSYLLHYLCALARPLVLNYCVAGVLQVAYVIDRVPAVHLVNVRLAKRWWRTCLGARSCCSSQPQAALIHSQIWKMKTHF